MSYAFNIFFNLLTKQKKIDRRKKRKCIGNYFDISFNGTILPAKIDFDNELYKPKIQINGKFFFLCFAFLSFFFTFTSN